MSARRRDSDARLLEMDAERSELEGEVGKLQVAVAVEEARGLQIDRELQTANDALSAAEVPFCLHKQPSKECSSLLQQAIASSLSAGQIAVVEEDPSHGTASCAMTVYV